MRFTQYIILTIALLASSGVFGQTGPGNIIVPLGGNSWVKAGSKTGEEKVTNNGWEHWQDANAVWTTYINIPGTGKLKLSAVIHVPTGTSKLKWTINGISKMITVTGADKTYEIGEWDITQPGYVKISAKGISKTGDLFAEMSDLQMEGTATAGQTAFVKNNEGNYFYWGRRGPSVHINYNLDPADTDIEWFYSEITVPHGNDVIGSYFMANGFAEGYFGMQVNSPAERRILFSVWSPFVTDDPKAIPEDKKIILNGKGDGVYTGEFGNEGSGGQSYLKYDWKAGVRYKFLIQARPVENNYTSYTAWFYAPEKRQWMLIAGFKRPATSTYLKKLHSFLENFVPETGVISRKAWYHDQWVRTSRGVWKPVTRMHLTADATARKGYRLDFDGGVQNGKFFLRNCGFFNAETELKKTFSIQAPKRKPAVELFTLPR